MILTICRKLGITPDRDTGKRLHALCRVVLGCLLLRRRLVILLLLLVLLLRWRRSLLLDLRHW